MIDLEKKVSISDWAHPALSIGSTPRAYQLPTDAQHCLKAGPVMTQTKQYAIYKLVARAGASAQKSTLF